MICDAIEASAMNVNPTKGMFIMCIQYGVAEEYGSLECEPDELIKILKSKVSLCFEIDRGFQYLDGPFDEKSEKAKIYCMIKEAVHDVVLHNEEDGLVEI